MGNIIHELIQENEHLPVHFDIVDHGNITVPAHWHHDIELIYPLTSSMTAVVQAQKYQLFPGDLLMINSGELHMTQRADDHMAYLILQIPMHLLVQIFPGFDLLHFQHFISRDAVEKSPLLHHSLEQMMMIFSSKSDGYQFSFIARLYDLLFALYKDFSSWKAVPSDSCQNRDLTRIIRISSFYKELCHSDVSIPVLMEQNGITNYKTFIHTFRQMYGATPQSIRSREHQYQKPDTTS